MSSQLHLLSSYLFESCRNPCTKLDKYWVCDIVSGNIPPQREASWIKHWLQWWLNSSSVCNFTCNYKQQSQIRARCSLLAQASFPLYSPNWRHKDKRPLPWVETDCVEQAPRLPSDRTITWSTFSPWSNYTASLNDSGVTVNESTRDSGLKSQSANNTGSMRFLSVVHDHGWRLNQSLFRPRAEVSFPFQFSKYNGKEASASRES